MATCDMCIVVPARDRFHINETVPEAALSVSTAAAVAVSLRRMPQALAAGYEETVDGCPGAGVPRLRSNDWIRFYLF